MRSILALLAGMAATSAALGTLAGVGGAWIVSGSNDGRMAALVVLALFGLMLLFPALAERVLRPLVGVGSSASQAPQPRPSRRRDRRGHGIPAGVLRGPGLSLVQSGPAPTTFPDHSS